MGFGDFAMGYLLGQSFAGPVDTDIPMDYKYWSKEAKAQHQKNCEEAYWSAWDAAVKEGYIRDLREHKKDSKFLYSAYPNMTFDEQADLIESGELKIVAPVKEPTGLSAMWADNTREEAQNKRYQEILKINQENIKNGSYRIVN